MTIFHYFVLILSLYCIIAIISPQNLTSPIDSDETRIYDLKKCGGAGCPYTASWLIHWSLFRKTHWWLDSTKMEAASFIIFDKARWKFQLSDPDAYYVHHMSMFEHLLHKKIGFDIAKNQTFKMSEAAFQGECNNLDISNTRDYVAIIPFFGGLPPNVTSSLTVKSLGQGNSLVNAETKALQCMASICSSLRYFGHVALGVVRHEDKALMLKMLDTVDVKIRQRVHVIQFKMGKPAHLPFHLIAWAQTFIQQYNCEGRYKYFHPYPQYLNFTHGQEGHRRRRLLGGGGKGGHSKRMDGRPPKHARTTGASSSLLPLSARGGLYNRSNIFDIYNPIGDIYKMCNMNFTKFHHGGPVHVSFHRKSIFHIQSNEYTNESLLYFDKDDAFDIENKYKYRDSRNNHDVLLGDEHLPVNYYHPIRYVYYSECDQIVRFDSLVTLKALTVASNETTFFVGRRREKLYSSEPSDYMGSLDSWRNCGVPGYSLYWPKDIFVQETK